MRPIVAIFILTSFHTSSFNYFALSLHLPFRDDLIRDAPFYFSDHFFLTKNPLQYGLKVSRAIEKCAEEMRETPPSRHELKTLCAEITRHTPLATSMVGADTAASAASGADPTASDAAVANSGA